MATMIKQRMTKQEMRIRRATKTRKKIMSLGKPWMTVHRSAKNIYAQVLQIVVKSDRKCVEVIASGSTNDKSLRDKCKPMSNIDAAKEIGRIVAAAAVKKGVTKISFDRSGYKFHGRVKALAEGAREGGLDF